MVTSPVNLFPIPFEEVRWMTAKFKTVHTGVVIQKLTCDTILILLRIIFFERYRFGFPLEYRVALPFAGH